MSVAPSPTDALQADIADSGFVFVPGEAMRAHLINVTPADIEAFRQSWNDLALDRFMADGGRYRRRRHAVFDVSGAKVTRLPHQPHYQSTEYNPLNGGVERWFEPVTATVEHNPMLGDLFAVCRRAFQLDAAPQWRTEMHQFRIEATPDTAGLPTPEGMHRDGVDWVCVVLIDRVNLAEGTTSIAGPGRKPLGSFTLTHPFDAVLLDDHRVMHGVTAIHRLDPAKPGYRDVLILTFKRA